MKSGFTLVCGASCFLFGLGFYHYVLLLRQFPSFSYHLPVIGNFHHLSKENVNVQQLTLRNYGDAPLLLPLSEVVKGPLKQDDPMLINYIRKNGYLIPPPHPEKPYNLSNPNFEDTSMGQAKMVLKALNELRNGFFVECGALDGELRSNTLLLERRYGWKGLLIEGDPKNQALLKLKNRKAWISPTCLATREYPHQVIFEQSFNRGRISAKHSPSVGLDPPPGTAQVQCFPLFSLLSALNISEVDYLSLDVEGSELAVLDTLPPFPQLKVRVMSVEFLHVPGGREALRKKMVRKGYHVFGAVRDPVHNWANDLIFIHNSVIL